MSAEDELDGKIPMDAILRAVERFLADAGWLLEFDGHGKLPIPQESRPVVVSRAFIKAHAPDVFLVDHHEAVVALAPEVLGQNLVARAGTLKLYFDREGRFISEDRFPPVR